MVLAPAAVFGLTGGAEVRYGNDFSSVRVLETRLPGVDIDAIALAPNLVQLALGAENGRILIYNLQSPDAEPAAELSGHSDGIQALLWTPDSATLISASSDHTVRIWTAVAGGEAGLVCITVLADFEDWVCGAAFDCTLSRVVFCSDDNAISVVAVDSWTRTARYEVTDYTPGCLATHPRDAALVAVGCNEGSVRLLSLDEAPTPSELQLFHGHTQGMFVDSVEFSRDGLRLLSGSNHFHIMVHEVATGAALLAVKQNIDDLWRVCFNQDCTLILATRQRYGVAVISAATGELEQGIQVEKPVLSVAAPMLYPWHRLCGLRELCVGRLSRLSRSAVNFSRLPTHVRDEIFARSNN
eukprot:TRINITY_DN3143_c0_g1_i1.p1 TRINITY_DN3143_c0_g1~~TRINITY_DN3143_c0_g1_i1.p1  ORF type:complete len:355 (-),score=70.48 TRINITY_DN3143_c0_g1_i1:73-1137(-)